MTARRPSRPGEAPSEEPSYRRRRGCPSSDARGTVESHRGVEVAFVEETALLVVAAAIFIWGAVSARLERADLTAPIVFTAMGAVLAGFGLVNAHAAPEQLKPLVEVTLVWVLFSDAARVRVHDLRRDVGGVLRLLAVGLPLTVLAGWGLAFWLFPALGVWLDARRLSARRAGALTAGPLLRRPGQPAGQGGHPQ